MNKSWATRVRELRSARGWSRDDLAKELRVSVHTIVDYENDRSEPIGPAQVVLEQLEASLATT
jgi:ribosome-binding protein aMBF1 (putative translation factor)